VSRAQPQQEQQHSSPPIPIIPRTRTHKTVDDDAPAPAPAPTADDEGDELLLDLTLKKKKKKKKARAEDELGLGGDDDGGGLGGEGGLGGGDGDEAGGGGEGAASAAASGPVPGQKGGCPWSGTDREYGYDELLDRVFGILRERNPELTGERRRTVLRPPQVAREGTKKTVFTNFAELCKAMNRNQDHVSAFLLSELGTSGSLDGQARLIVKGRFLPKSFETVLRRYVNEYVLCPGCKSVDTLLDRDSATRLMHLRCQQCGASRTVQAIKSGFVARVGRRVQAA
jgi:translation initiation factor 2 subunit 2